MTLLLIYLFLVVFFATLCSILEATLFSATPSYIQSLEKRGFSQKTVKLINDLKSNINRPISSILTINTFATTMGAAGVGAQAHILFGNEAQTLIAFTLTIIVLYFAEIFPKTLAAIYWKKFIIPAAYIISFLIKITFPFVFIATFMTNYLQKNRIDGDDYSEDEIIALANLGHKEGNIEKKESNLIENLFKLRSIQTKEIMTPRSVIFAFSGDLKVEDAIKDDNMYIHSRIPIYSTNIDNIEGVVFSQDILEKSSDDLDETTLKEISKPVLKVYKDTPVNILIDLFVEKKTHLFLVVDEYEQTSGIVTLEDAIETLLGVEIVDEKDKFEDMQEFAKQRAKTRVKW